MWIISTKLYIEHMHLVTKVKFSSTGSIRLNMERNGAMDWNGLRVILAFIFYFYVFIIILSDIQSPFREVRIWTLFDGTVICENQNILKNTV